LVGNESSSKLLNNGLKFIGTLLEK